MKYPILIGILIVLLLIPGVFADYNAADSRVEAKVYVASPEVYSSTGSDLSYTASGNNSIAKCVLWLDSGESATFALGLADGSTLYGSAFYTQEGTNSKLEVNIQGLSNSQTWLNPIPLAKRVLICYGYDGNGGGPGIIVQDFDRSYFSILGQDAFVFCPIAGIDRNLIQSAAFSTMFEGQEISVDFFYGPTGNISDEAKAGLEDQLWQILSGFIEMLSWIPGVVLTIVYWFKVIFIDNLLLTVGLYFGISMAFCFGSTNDLPTAFKNFIGYQIKLWNFVGFFIHQLVQIFAAIKDALLPW